MMEGRFDWREEPIGRQHQREDFDCGVKALDDYLVRFARQNHESGGAKTYVAVALRHPRLVIGFYSLSPGAIDFVRVPARITRKLGRYEVPIFRLGRLAVDKSAQGRGLGSDLLLAAATRAMAVAQVVGGVALAIDAKDERAAAWYARLGAQPLLDDPLKLVLPFSTVAASLALAQRS